MSEPHCVIQHPMALPTASTAVQRGHRKNLWRSNCVVFFSSAITYPTAVQECPTWAGCFGWPMRSPFTQVSRVSSQSVEPEIERYETLKFVLHCDLCPGNPSYIGRAATLTDSYSSFFGTNSLVWGELRLAPIRASSRNFTLEGKIMDHDTFTYSAVAATRL